jgi:dipeptidyl aminopeptidase/acylaminoacyl peptidase
MKKFFSTIALLLPVILFAQNYMTPELLWKLGRVTGLGISKDGKYVVYTVTTPDVETNKSKRKSYIVPVGGGAPVEISNTDSLLNNKNISADGKYLLSDKEVKLKKVSGSDYYPELSKSNAYIYDNLNDRHWDQWEDGKYNHVFVMPVGKPEEDKDIMPNDPYDSPQKPFGGDEDYVWNPDSKHVVYVSKKKFGKDYALSTNTDLYEYDVTTGTTKI